MAIFFLYNDGEYHMNQNDWASTLLIYKGLQAHYGKLYFQVTLPKGKTLQNCLEYLRWGPFMGHGGDYRQYKVKVIEDWHRYVDRNFTPFRAELIRVEALELDQRLDEEGWMPVWTGNE